MSHTERNKLWVGGVPACDWAPRIILSKFIKGTRNCFRRLELAQGANKNRAVHQILLAYVAEHLMMTKESRLSLFDFEYRQFRASWTIGGVACGAVYAYNISIFSTV